MVASRSQRREPQATHDGCRRRVRAVVRLTDAQLPRPIVPPAIRFTSGRERARVRGTDDDRHCGETMTPRSGDPAAYAGYRGCQRVLADHRTNGPDGARDTP